MAHSWTECRNLLIQVSGCMSRWTGRGGYVRQVMGHHISRVMQTCFNAGLYNMGTKIVRTSWCNQKHSSAGQIPSRASVCRPFAGSVQGCCCIDSCKSARSCSVCGAGRRQKLFCSEPLAAFQCCCCWKSGLQALKKLYMSLQHMSQTLGTHQLFLHVMQAV